MNVDNFRLLQYRRMMKSGQRLQPDELLGSWRGVNKGIATWAIDDQFVKHFRREGGQVYGGNISVHQVPNDQLAQSGWRPINDQSFGSQKRELDFLVQTPKRKRARKKGVVLNYRKGGNRMMDPTKLILDELVRLDENHLLGRATVRLGPIKIPVAYFVLERTAEQY